MKSSFAVLVFVAMAMAHSDDSNNNRARGIGAIYTTCTDPNTVALTFDDGPHIYEKSLSAKLSSEGIKATFFVNGDNYNCIYDPNSVSSLKTTFAAGHQIGSHTWAHKDLATLNEAQLNVELFRIEDALDKILGIRPALMRPPFGSYNTLIREVAFARNQTVVIWDFDSGDSTGASAQQLISSYDALINSKPYNVMSLNHETSRTTVDEVIPQAITKFKAAGYKFVTVSECLGVPAYQSVRTPGPRDASWTC